MINKIIKQFVQWQHFHDYNFYDLIMNINADQYKNKHKKNFVINVFIIN